MIHKDGHSNQAGGCCCPSCGNTCGFHPEWQARATLTLNLPPYEPEVSELEDASRELKRLQEKHNKTQ